MEQVKWTGRERDALMFTVALEDNATKAGRVLEKRLRAASPVAWRDWRLVQTLLTKTVARLVHTLPDRNVEQLRVQLLHTQLRFTMPGPVRAPDYCFVREADMQVLGKYAMRNECTMCLKSPEEAKKCELFKVLQWVAPLPDRPEHASSMCDYAQVIYTEEE